MKRAKPIEAPKVEEQPKNNVVYMRSDVADVRAEAEAKAPWYTTLWRRAVLWVSNKRVSPK